MLLYDSIIPNVNAKGGTSYFTVYSYVNFAKRKFMKKENRCAVPSRDVLCIER